MEREINQNFKDFKSGKWNYSHMFINSIIAHSRLQLMYLISVTFLLSYFLNDFQKTE